MANNGTSETLVRIPAPLRSLTGGAGEVKLEGATVGDVLGALERKHKGISERILDGGKAVRPFVNIFVGSDNVKSLQGLNTRVKSGDVISIVPAVAGGLS